MISSVHIVYASTSGNTEYVVDALAGYIGSHSSTLKVELQRAERATAKDLLLGDMLILGSGTWNADGSEGQLNPIMHNLLFDRAKTLDLGGRYATCISLGDDRYHFRTRCTEHFLRFLREHNGQLFIPPLVIVNDPYGQEDKIRQWAEKLLDHAAHIHKNPAASFSEAP